MEKMKTKEIKVISNPRKDFGDMEGLKESIKQEGILQPLLVNANNELIVGERRLRAALELEIEEVPVIRMEIDKDAKLTEERIKLVENLHRKDLTPVEEAGAFVQLMEIGMKTPEEIAAMIGKSANYIKRRTTLLKLIPAVQEALNKHKIELGHAIIMANLGKNEQKEKLKDLLQYGMGVQNFEDFIDDAKCKDMQFAMFDGKECKGCVNNGNEQTLLFDTKDATKGKCMNPACFIEKTNKWIEEETATLKAKGINVLTSEEVRDIKGAEIVHNWNESEYKKAVKNLEKKPEEFAVVFSKGYNDRVEKQIWSIKKKEKEEVASDEEVEEKLNLNNVERLNQKVDVFKRELILGNTHPDKYTEDDGPILTLIAMHLNDDKPHIANELKAKQLYAMDSTKLMNRFREYGNDMLDEIMELDELEYVAELNGFDMKKSFIMTDEFLAMFRKEQLKELAKEGKVDVESLEKMDELKEAIKKGWKKGNVPKVLRRKK